MIECAGSIKIDPGLRPEVVRSMWEAQGYPDPDEYEQPAPPMQWIEAVRISGNTQESWHFSRRRAIGFG